MADHILLDLVTENEELRENMAKLNECFYQTSKSLQRLQLLVQEYYGVAYKINKK